MAVGLGAGNGEVGFVLGALACGLAIYGLRRLQDVARAEQDFRAMIENAPVGVFRSTLDGRFLVANSAVARMLGYASSQALIESLDDIPRKLYVDSEEPSTYLDRLQRDAPPSII